VCGVWCVVCGGVVCGGVVCGVWCVVCGVWCVVCGVWCVVCGVWCVGLTLSIRRCGFSITWASDSWLSPEFLSRNI
jgi:hypothetical protein